MRRSMLAGKMILWKCYLTRQWMRFIRKREAGIGVVEVILILVVLIGLVIIFKSQLTTIVNDIFKKISSQSSGI